MAEATPDASRSQRGQTAPATVEGEARGTTLVHPRALRTIVRQAALAVGGTVEHTSGFNRLTGRSYPLVDVSVTDQTVRAEVHVAVEWPGPVTGVARRCRENVIATLAAHLPRHSSQVDVHVAAAVPGPLRLDTLVLPFPEPQDADPAVTSSPVLPPARRIISVAAPARHPVASPEPPSMHGGSAR